MSLPNYWESTQKKILLRDSKIKTEVGLYSCVNFETTPGAYGTADVIDPINNVVQIKAFY